MKKIGPNGVLVSLLVIVSFMTLPASGQTLNPVILTWQANNYFPADYAGKALATPNTPVIVSAELIQNNKLADITKADIAWYVDGTIITRGTGIKTISFTAKQNDSGFDTVRAIIALGGNSFDNSIQIPINRPFVAMNVASPDKTAKIGSQVSLEAIPFFFNISSLQDLTFSWQVNNQTVPNQGSNLSLQVGAPQSESQNSLPVSVTVQNSGNPYEFNRGFVNLSLVQ